MSFLANTIGTTANTGINASYTFTASKDTTTLQTGAFNLRTYLGDLGVIPSYGPTLRLTVTINSGVQLSSSDPGKPVITVSGFKSRDTVTIINNGNIYGAGGTGGPGGYKSGGSKGGTGGTGILLSNYCTIVNNGKIYAGGGGQGGSGGDNTAVYSWRDKGQHFIGCYNCGVTNARNTGETVCIDAINYGGACGKSGSLVKCAHSCILKCKCAGTNLGCCTDTCCWPNCTHSGICGCGGCDANSGYGQYKGLAYFIDQEQYISSYTYATGAGGSAGSLGASTAGSGGASAGSYSAGAGGDYGTDIAGKNTYATYSGSGTTGGHYT